MHLAELIPARTTDPAVLDGLETFLATTLGKGVVYAKDTPNFIGNRIGVFSMLADDAPHRRIRPGLRRGRCADRPGDRPPEDGDLPHRRRRRPRHDGARDQDDGRHAAGRSLAPLLQGAGRGCRRWSPRARSARRPAPASTASAARTSSSSTWQAQDYRPSAGEVDAEVGRDPEGKDPAKKFAKLRASEHPQAQFLWAVLPRPVPLQRLPPGRHRRHRARRRLRDPLGLRLVARPVRDLAGRGLEAGRRTGSPRTSTPARRWQRAAAGLGVRRPRRRARRRGQLQPGAQRASCRAPRCPVYKRQRFPDPVLGERFDPGKTVFENDGVRLWHDGDGIAVRRFKTKMHTVNDQVLDGIQQAIGDRRTRLPGPGDLAAEGALLRRRRPRRRARPAAGRQRRRLRSDGRALPGHQPAHQVLARAGRRRGARPGAGRRLRVPDAFGAHVLRARKLHRPGRSRRRPAAGRRRPEGNRGARVAGRGPGRRRVRAAQAGVRNGRDGARCRPRRSKRRNSSLRATTTSSSSTPTNCCTSRAQQARALAESGYRPPLPARRIPVAGDVGIATFKMMLVNMLEGRFISAARLRDRHAHRHRAVRRRRRPRHAGRRGVAAARSSASTSSRWRRCRRRRNASRTC